MDTGMELKGSWHISLERHILVFSLMATKKKNWLDIPIQTTQGMLIIVVQFQVFSSRSVAGPGLFFSWTSRLQRCVSLSTAEAEFIAACESTKEAVWLRSLLTEILGVNNGSTPLLCDNEGAIRLVKNPEFHQRTKPIDIKYHFIREKHQDKEIEIVYAPTENQLADLFTKPLPTPRFNQLRKQIGVYPL